MSSARGVNSLRQTIAEQRRWLTDDDWYAELALSQQLRVFARAGMRVASNIVENRSIDIDRYDQEHDTPAERRAARAGGIRTRARYVDSNRDDDDDEQIAGARANGMNSAHTNKQTFDIRTTAIGVARPLLARRAADDDDAEDDQEETRASEHDVTVDVRHFDRLHRKRTRV